MKEETVSSRKQREKSGRVYCIERKRKRTRRLEREREREWRNLSQRERE